MNPPDCIIGIDPNDFSGPETLYGEVLRGDLPAVGDTVGVVLWDRVDDWSGSLAIVTEAHRTEPGRYRSDLWVKARSLPSPLLGAYRAMAASACGDA